MTIARRVAALPARERSQWPDPGENPHILNDLKVCAAFVNYSSSQAATWAPTIRAPAPSSGTSKSSFMCGKTRSRAPPRFAAMRRPSPTRAGPKGNGHVGFVVAWTSTTVTLLGGNQGNTVCERTFPRLEKNSSVAKESEFVRFLMPVIV
ncbi:MULTISPECIES: hypothetical protein [Rhizobium]|nr:MULTISPECIES: hypothetical protein [Rhizobium]MCS0458799.1 hypothetical protein [Rhizobium favelukesii]UFS80724.1 hypothetical protein LPB79_20380 [Rhizobium sp. T136]